MSGRDLRLLYGGNPDNWGSGLKNKRRAQAPSGQNLPVARLPLADSLNNLAIADQNSQVWPSIERESRGHCPPRIYATPRIPPAVTVLLDSSYPLPNTRIQE
jgi:hypothetical protein